jgi:pyruvate formate lyase activating enzyme
MGNPVPRVTLPLAHRAEVPADAPTLPAALAARTTRGVLWEPGPEAGYVRCVACAHRCVMDEGRAGACGVRFHRSGELRVPFGYVARRYVRAVETNTIFHVRPGARALTFGMYGCDLRCPYCHNWNVSQALREDVGSEAPLDVSAGELVEQAVAHGCEVVCGAFNEPMISAEWAHAVFTAAKARGLVTGLISDANTTPEALAYMRPVTDVFRADLKGFTAEQYRALGGRLVPVMEAIREAKRLGYWVEVVTLVVPGFNDDAVGLRDLATQLAAIDPWMPWHLNAFRPHYKLTDRPRTDGLSLVSAAGAAYARGLKFVYVSNRIDQVRELSHTRCPECFTTLVERYDYETRAVALVDGRCPECSAALPGLWGSGARVRGLGAAGSSERTTSAAGSASVFEEDP